jgi:hypothetical protein
MHEPSAPGIELAEERDDEHAAADPDRVPSSRRDQLGLGSESRFDECAPADGSLRGIEYGACRHHRPASRGLAAGVLIRDQRPMPPKALMRCLRSGLMPEDWFELLNSKIFFWLDPRRLNRQRLACGASPQVALVGTRRTS